MMVLLHWLSQCLISAISVSMLFPAEAQDRQTTFIFNHFDGSDLILTNDASIASKAIRLTSDSDQMFGRALYSIPVQTKGLESFSTTFVFCMVPAPASQGGHGMAFMMTPYASPMGVVGAQYLGLLNTTSNGQRDNHLFAVEFDRVLNVEYRDMDNNHVGVDVNSLTSSASKSAGYWVGNHFQKLKLNSGQNIQAWIDYHQKQLNVSITLAGLAKPIRPLISLNDFDLSLVLQNRTFVGFSAATGTFIEEHDILAWSFNTKGMAPALDVSNLPSFARKESIYQSAGFKAVVSVASLLVLFLLAVAVFQFLRTKCTQRIEQWELEYWPHRFSYRELRLATKGFRDDRLLGSGGFGRVYKGDIPGTGLQVAVKCIKREVTAGMKEFIAEISTMGRLQHRNLVQLRGWSRKDQQLFIVYDYMANGSLDRMLFGPPTTVLGWSQRYKVLKGVAAGLLYLHEQWEKMVVHRDIKPSNVLLDSELNARLGDFGLARLYDHAQNPQTTRVVGTIGYIAPEVAVTGKATPSSDVFSFGVVLLEVACGRRPVERSKDDAEALILVDWIWDLYAEGKLTDAADPNLGGEYDVEQKERVLRLGLFCCQSEPECRPGIGQALRILDGEAAVPLLQVPSFNTSIIVKSTPVGSHVHVTDESSYASSAMARSTSSSKETRDRFRM